MKKDFTRDYVTEIFRVWAAAGMPTYDEARERVYKTDGEAGFYGRGNGDCTSGNCDRQGEGK